MSVISYPKLRTQRIFESIQISQVGRDINRCNLSVLKLSEACQNSV